MYVIFGASGHVGRATATRLAQAGHPVRAVVRKRERVADLAALGCEIAVADLNDSGSIRQAMEGALAVQVLCPVTPAEREPKQVMMRFIDLMALALEADPPARVLALSDYGAERAQGTGLTLLFHYLEQRFKTIPTSLILLRSAEHMQNYLGSAKAALTSGVLQSLHHPVSKRFPIVAAQDVGYAAADLLTSAAPPTSVPLVVNIEGAQRLCTAEIALCLSQLGGRAIIANPLPREHWAGALQNAGLSPAYAELVADLYDAHNAGRIEVEDLHDERRLGSTTLTEVLRPLCL